MLLLLYIKLTHILNSTKHYCFIQTVFISFYNIFILLFAFPSFLHLWVFIWNHFPSAWKTTFSILFSVSLLRWMFSFCLKMSILTSLLKSINKKPICSSLHSDSIFQFKKLGEYMLRELILRAAMRHRKSRYYPVS